MFALLPFWVLNLLCDKVQGVPAGVGEQSRIEGQGDGTRVARGALERVFEALCFSCGWESKAHLSAYTPADYQRISRPSVYCLGPTSGHLQDSHDDDEEERQEFSVGENVLN